MILAARLPWTVCTQSLSDIGAGKREGEDEDFHGSVADLSAALMGWDEGNTLLLICCVFQVSPCDFRIPI